MARTSKASRVVGLLSDATGRTDEEVAFALTVGVAAAALTSVVFGALRLLDYLEELGN